VNDIRVVNSSPRTNGSTLFRQYICPTEQSPPGHLLIIPGRHVASVFEATSIEIPDLWNLVCRAKEYLDQKYSPDGYNIGINDGESAGQTVMHLHIHLIPRYRDDMDDPRGGVRGVIPEKQKYES
jgi:diadenosine tetraphosphate (Ap4A) HIT family hydrolase